MRKACKDLLPVDYRSDRQSTFVFPSTCGFGLRRPLQKCVPGVNPLIDVMISDRSVNAIHTFFGLTVGEKIGVPVNIVRASRANNSPSFTCTYRLSDRTDTADAKYGRLQRLTV